MVGAHRGFGAVAKRGRSSACRRQAVPLQVEIHAG